MCLTIYIYKKLSIYLSIYNYIVYFSPYRGLYEEEVELLECRGGQQPVCHQQAPRGED